MREHPERERLARLVADATADVAREAMTSFPLPGGVITLGDCEGILAEATFGFANLEHQVPMTAACRFEIGSVSKVFLSLVINRLIEDGRLDLDECVAPIVPWAGLEGRDAAVTVMQLLTHTSGLFVGADTLPDDPGEIWNSRHARGTSSEEVRFHYSNYGYLLLGEVARARAGKPVAQLVREQWLEPLGMCDSLAAVAQFEHTEFATGYWPARPDRPWVPGDALAPATWFEIDSASGNVVSTSGDMARFMKALLDASAPENRSDSVLGHETFTRMTTILAPTGEPTYVVEGVRAVEESRYGLGINVERIEGNLCVSHGGGMVGYSTFMLVDVSAGVGVSVLTNANGDTLASHILARIAHSDLVNRLEGVGPLKRVRLDATVLAHETGDIPGGAHLGSFVGDDEEAFEVSGAPGAPVVVRYEGATGTLYLMAGGRYVTDHPALRRFHLDWHATPAFEGWTYGATSFRLAGVTAVARAVTPNPLVGHYRSFSPWFPEFRVIERAGRLMMVAPGGVEGPDEEMELVEVSPGEYRIGGDPWLPERLVEGARRDGEVIWLSRDGCVYSRSFSP